MPNRLLRYTKELRNRSTDAERLIWSHIRAKRFEGLKFRRQHQIGNYIVDFVCLDKKIIIELDGGQHNDPTDKTHDTKRNEWLKGEGYTVLRFWDNDVFLNSNEVLTVIRECCFNHPPLNPLPSREGT